MLKDKMKPVLNFVVKNSKFVLPVVLILAVAVTVSVALKANDERANEDTDAINLASSEVAVPTEAPVEITPVPVTEDVLLIENTNSELHTLICTYYSAYAYGDVETIKGICNYLSETDEIRIQAMSEYVESYPSVQIYTKPGPVENSYLAYVCYQMTVTNFTDNMPGMETFYVCTDENGKLYLNEGEVSEEELEYIRKVNLQDDVVELNNRVNVECSDVFKNNADLYYYIQEIVKEVQKSTGEVLASQVTENADESGTGETTNDAGTTDGTDSGVEATTPTEQPAQVDSAEPVYAKATTTVNVRVSDSEQADKVGKVAGGTKVEVLAQQVNGWTKIRTSEFEGFIKSEYLQLMNSASSADAIGSVTAISNVNVRMSASETADRLGVLAGGETVELLGRENGWCKINYNGQEGYVKEDYVQ